MTDMSAPTLEQAKHDLDRQKFEHQRAMDLQKLHDDERNRTWQARAGQAVWTGLGVAVPVVVALVAGLIALRGGILETEAGARQKAAELALAGVSSPSEISRRLNIVYRLIPEVRKDLEAAKLVDPSPRPDAGVPYLFGTADEARYEFFKAASAKAGCAQEVAELWRLMFGTKRVADETAVRGYEWAEGINLRGLCPSAPAQ